MTTKPRTIIKAGRRPLLTNLKKLVQYRELLWSLAYRDIRVKYAQTAIGIAWAVINPVISLVVLTFVFGNVAKVDTGGIPHPVFTIAGLCGWSYFSNVFSQAGTSLIGAQAMIKKIAFPKLVIPLSKSIAALLDLAVVLVILLVMMLVYQVPVSGNIAYLPVFILISILAGLTGGIFTAAFTIRFRDFRYVVPMILRVGMFATPIAYPAANVPEKYQFFFYLNPMAGVVEGMRWSLFGGGLPIDHVLLSTGILLVVLAVAVYYFNVVEHKIADII